MPRPRHRYLHLLEVATVGFPFCAFKLLTGRLALSLPWGAAFGWVLIALGLADLLLNTIALASTLTGRESPLAVCTFQQIVTLRRGTARAWRELGLSMDAMLAFLLVALMIGLGGLKHLAMPELQLWNVAVVLNVLGAGLGRLAESLLEIERA